jgi:arogenate dehydrogenase (NADP+)
MKIGIVGLGLIGGSLALDLRSLHHQVFGVSRQEQTWQRAKELQAIDVGSVDLSILKAVEIIFICTPIDKIEPEIRKIKECGISEQTIITDVGSVKKQIVNDITPDLWHNFVGGHPMAGKAESGLEVAERNLFVDKPYVITPVETTPPAAMVVVEEIVRSLGAKLYRCSPEAHDRAVAWISHLPVMVSGSLIAACQSDRESLELAQKLASSGFRDTSRVGGGNPELGVMMAKYNRSELLRSLDRYRQNLDWFIEAIEQENWEALEQQLQKNQQARTKFSGV